MRRRAFTLAEITAGVVIAGIVATIAVVGFQQVISRTGAVGPELLVQQAAATLQFSYESRGFFPATAQQAAAVDDTITWVAGPAAEGEVSYAVTSGGPGTFALVVTRRGGECFGRAADAAGETGQGRDVSGSWSAGDVPCDAASAAAVLLGGA